MATPRKLIADLRSSFFTHGPRQAIDSDAAVAAFAGAISRFAAQDFYCVMDGGALTTRYEGIDGLREGWNDFLGAFETILIESGEVFDTEDGLLEHVRLVGKPEGTDGEIAQDAAAVWRVRGDELTCVEFHLDRDRARVSAGLAD